MLQFHCRIEHKYIPLYAECYFNLVGNDKSKDAKNFQKMIDDMCAEIGSKQEMVDITVKRIYVSN